LPCLTLPQVPANASGEKNGECGQPQVKCQKFRAFKIERIAQGGEGGGWETNGCRPEREKCGEGDRPALLQPPTSGTRGIGLPNVLGGLPEEDAVTGKGAIVPILEFLPLESAAATGFVV